MFILIGVQLGTMIYSFVNYTQVSVVGEELWFKYLGVDKRTDFQKRHQCFGYGEKIDIGVTQFRTSCQESFDEILSWKFILIFIILLLVILFNLVDMSIAFYLARQFPPNEARQAELEILRQNYEQKYHPHHPHPHHPQNHHHHPLQNHPQNHTLNINSP